MPFSIPVQLLPRQGGGSSFNGPRRTKTLILLVLFGLGQLLNSRGALTWHWISYPSDNNISNTIANSMNSAVASFNTYANYSGDIAVRYNSGVPTAQTDGYQGWIEFGGSMNYRTAMHEIEHWLGVGTYGTWSGFVAGEWAGCYGNAAIQAYDGPTAKLGCDSQHFWPYGWNYDNEAVYPERHIGMIGALRRDMGLSDMTIGIAPGTYRLRNRATLKMLDNGGTTVDGAQVRQYQSSASANQQWTATLLSGGYFSLTCVSSGKRLDSLGAMADGSPIVQASASGSTSQQWQIVQTDSGYYKIINRANGKCLDAGGQTADGTGMQNWTVDSSSDQEWKFVSTIVQTPPAIGVVSQGQPVTSSSVQSGNYDWNGNDGVAQTRWTASDGSYPQWWRVDLGSVQPITKVVIDWYDTTPRSYQYKIETSTDDVTYAVAVDKTGNTTQGMTTDSLSANARYVRVTVTGSTGGYAAFWDCRVYNESLPMILVSQFRPVTASSFQTGNLPANGNDGDSTFTRWAASDSSYPQSWRVDLGSVQPVSKAVITWFGGNSRTYKYRIETSDNDSTYTTVVDKTGNTTPGTTTDAFSALARYVRVTVVGVNPSGGWAGFYEFNLYSRLTALPPLRISPDSGGNAITASWPAGFVGCRLETQTGLPGTNWVTVPNSTNLSQISLPMDATNTGVFFRLAWP